MRPNRATWILTAAATAALAVPAFADERDAQAKRGERLLPAPKAAAAKLADIAREARRERRGPVHPLAAKPDYGTDVNGFGARSGRGHQGQDVFAPSGTPLVAVTDAVVADTGSDGGQGNYVHLFDPRANRTYVYMHMVAPASVKPGERVRTGQRVGGVGCTGSCWGDHLHFEIREGKGFLGEPVDPLPQLQRWRAVGA